MNKTSELVFKLNSLTQGFSGIWEDWAKEDKEYGDGEPPNEHTVFSEYTHFIINQLDRLSSGTKTELFTFIDSALNSEDEELSNAVATCFLENFVQMSNKFKPEDYFPYLGPASVSYSKAWDKFNGIKTKGLW